MKTLVGIDSSGTYRPALDLLGRLRFAENRTILAHIEPPVTGVLAGSPVLYDGSMAEVELAIERDGKRLLCEAERIAEGAGIEFTEGVQATGGTSGILLNLAEERRVDLVAIGSERRGRVGSFFFGSVGRALAINAASSFLIARNGGAGPVKAVFATDHSEYANRCFARLLDMNPKGLSEVTIVTATESILEERLSAAVGYAENTITEKEEVWKMLGDLMVDRLHRSGRRGEYRLVEGHPVDAIHRAMEETKADLLILGARGHGIVERLLIGSLALHCIVAEPYNVLVLRFPEDAQS